MITSDPIAARHYLSVAAREAEMDVVRLAGEAAAVRHIGVVGGGTMGTQIAVALLLAGYEVTVVEVDDGARSRAASAITAVLDKQVGRGTLGAERCAELPRQFATAGDISALAGAELIIEAVFEDLDIKRTVFRALDALPGSPVLASNTSYLDIDGLAAATRRPTDVVGMHFFAPAHVNRLAEVVRGASTSDSALATALAVMSALRKVAVIVGNGDGFVGNRVLAAYRRHCEILLEEGCLPTDVDAALTRFGMSMGPFAVADMSGLDIAWRRRQSTASTRDRRERYVPVADWLCEQGRLGQKTNAGWYRYQPGSRTPIDDIDVAALIERASAERGITRRAITEEEIVGRVLAVMINEAAAIVADRLVQRPSDIDLMLVTGYGFPRDFGGPVWWVTTSGRNQAAAWIDTAAAATGFGFRRADWDVLERVDVR